LAHAYATACHLVGLAQKLRGMENKINVTVLQKIVVGWVATIPIAMLISIILWVTLPAPTRAVGAQISKIC